MVPLSLPGALVVLSSPSTVDFTRRAVSTAMRKLPTLLAIRFMWGIGWLILRRFSECFSTDHITHEPSLRGSFAA